MIATEQATPSNIRTLAKSIKLVVFDVDGVLTDATLYFADNGMETKAFSTLDGLGIKFLQESGVETALITGRQSNIVQERAKDLHIHHVYQGNLEKIPAYEDLLHKLKLTDAQVAYMGDDLIDLPLIRRARLGIAPCNAADFVKQHADWVTTKSGGYGAVREVCDLIMEAQGTLDRVHQYYLSL